MYFIVVYSLFALQACCLELLCSAVELNKSFRMKGATRVLCSAFIGDYMNWIFLWDAYVQIYFTELALLESFRLSDSRFLDDFYQKSMFLGETEPSTNERFHRFFKNLSIDVHYFLKWFFHSTLHLNFFLFGCHRLLSLNIQIIPKSV